MSPTSVQASSGKRVIKAIFSGNEPVQTGRYRSQELAKAIAAGDLAKDLARKTGYAGPSESGIKLIQADWSPEFGPMILWLSDALCGVWIAKDNHVHEEFWPSETIQAGTYVVTGRR